LTFGLAKSAVAALLALLLLAPALCQAAGPTAVPRATSLLVDQARLLNDTERRAVEARLQAVQASGRAQIGVLIATASGDEPLAAYALRVAEAWKLGSQARDDGLLVVLVPSQHAARVEVGYGLEGDLPDARVALFLREYLQRSQGGDAAAALRTLLDRLDQALPPGTPLPRALTAFVRRHAEWKVPILLLVLSVFTLFPLLFASVFSRLGGGPSVGTGLATLISGGLFATVLGVSAKLFWDSAATGYSAAAAAFVLPLLWSLNAGQPERLGAIARVGRVVGLLGLLVYIFAALTLVVGAAMYVEQVREIWVAPLLGLLAAAGPLVLLVGGRAGAALMKFVGGYMYFLVALAVAYFALQGVLKDPTTTAFTVAAVFALLLAMGFALDDHEQAARQAPRTRRRGRWAWMFGAAAVLFLLPFLLVALIHALSGDAFATHFAMLMAGDSSFSQFVWWASGALGGSALLVGLGGKFGGGGAGS